MLSGTAPVPVSSGRTDRHRLNRLGDRQLNRALHQVAVTRMRCHPQTLAYIQRRRAEGKTDRDIRRCLKRYLARHLYRILNNQIPRTT
jgi:transposase